MAKVGLWFCLLFIGSSALFSQKRMRLADLPPFERAVLCVKYFEGRHSRAHYPYVGYGHLLQKGERFTADMPEWQADSLLRADLWKCFEYFKGYGKDALLLALLAYNVGVGKVMGSKQYPKSRLLLKIEQGDRYYYKEYLSFCHYKGKVLQGLLKRRKAEFALFYVP
ncbi:MAG: lysozyme [Alloprevotella sp.]|nr:lysozyme [Alloprevotella sp.]